MANEEKKKTVEDFMKNVEEDYLVGEPKKQCSDIELLEQIKNEFFILSTLMNLRKDSENAVGKLNFVLLEHQKVSIIIFQKNGMTFYVSIDRKEKDINSIILKIKKLI